MIRVLRAPSLASTKAAGDLGDPVIAGPTPLEVRQMVMASSSVFSGGERDTLLHVLSKLRENASADITLAANGSLFRICEHEPAPSAAKDTRDPGAADDCSWISSQPGTPVLLVDTDERIIRLSRALEFLGYDARSLVADEARRLLERMTAEHPLLLVLAEDAWRRFGEEIVPVAREQNVGLVTLGVAHRSRPSTIEAALDVPVQVRRIASTLDPAIARVKSRRAEPPARAFEGARLTG